MQLNEGNYYKARNGQVFGLMRIDPAPHLEGLIWDAGDEHFKKTRLHWHKDGTIGVSLRLFGIYDNAYDLLEEVAAPQ